MNPSPELQTAWPPEAPLKPPSLARSAEGRSAPPKFSQKKFQHYLPLKPLYHEVSSLPKNCLFETERTAVHSGKLGDLIYALPTCRALGINHLVLNTYLPPDDPLRWFTFSAARELVPLLLSQPYLREVSIVSCPVPLENAGFRFPGIDYNLDMFRQMPRHRIGQAIHKVPRFCNFVDEDAPSHLGEHFSAVVGIRVDLSEPWLFVPPSPKTAGAIVVSLTHNWRSYSNDYWHDLIKGIPNLIFVGTEREFSQAKFSRVRFMEAKDHLELASLIAGARGFLGTVSFPYSLAEGLKIPRLVEVCHSNLNAFPIGERGSVLPPDLGKARSLVSRWLSETDASSYRLSAPNYGSPKFLIRNGARRTRLYFTKANQTFSHRLWRLLRKGAHLLLLVD
jgi:hypothetical protein